MSLLEELEARGVTAEDLEKAASVRLFEKAAAAEGVNLDDLEENQVEELYAHFVSNNLSDADNTKEASAMNDAIVDLFEKTAAAEGINLDEMADDELAQLYNHYVENVLPEQMGEKQASEEEIVFDMFQKTAAAEGLDLRQYDEDQLSELYGHYVENVLPHQLGNEDTVDKVASALGTDRDTLEDLFVKHASASNIDLSALSDSTVEELFEQYVVETIPDQVKEAQVLNEVHEKLAEAETLGRHMARAYADELNQIGTGQRIRAALS